MHHLKQSENFEILVVDDDKISSLLHKNFLKNSSLRHSTVPFQSAKKAFEHVLLRNCYSNGFLVIILLDLHIP